MIQWILDTFTSFFLQEAAKDAKQKAALSPEDSEESPNAAQVYLNLNLNIFANFNFDEM